MNLTLLDWGIIGLYFLVSISIGIIMSKRAGKGMKDFFLSGRNLPWYIAGTSMVATTFAADTPLAVTELVAEKGISGNWLWWNMLFGGMLTVFFFAKLWRRSGILTDAEFVSIRYSGKPANFLRGFRAIYIGVFMNVIVIAWVNLAMVKILKVIYPDLSLFGISDFNFLGQTYTVHILAVAGIMIFTAIYSAMSGLWGISLTDSFQFIIAMTGSIILAIFAVNHVDVGGIVALKEKLPEATFDFFPGISETSETQSAGGILKMGLVAFIAYLGVQWWASWYPGAEPGGGGYIAQRMMSAKNEKHSLLATLWFQIAHFAIRPWPWILVALAAMVIYPRAQNLGQLKSENTAYYEISEKIFDNKTLTVEEISLSKSDNFELYYQTYDNTKDPGKMFPKLMADLLPPGLFGLLLAAFLAAYMSTIASQTVWGTSYIINDLYKPFINKKADEKKYVKVSRITTFLLMFFSLFVTTQFDTISGAWKFVLACSGGIGLVLILRWFWWRINAWSEISAMLAPYAIYPFLAYYEINFELTLIIIVIWATAVWLTVTFLTKPTSVEKLNSFYTKVHPGGIGWKPISDNLPDVKSDTGFSRLFFNWFAGSLSVMFSLFGIGKILFAEYLTGIVFIVIALLAGVVIYINLSKSEKTNNEK